jgi:hypothetical protein
MKSFLIAASVVAATLSIPVLAADVGISVSIGQPGFYGRIDIGDYPYPQPQVIYRQPRVIERVYIDREPIYMRVPPSHARNWRNYCHQYGACGERVYFVQNSWYNNEYAPRYQEQHRDRQDYRRDNRGNGNHGNQVNGNAHGRYQ